MTKIHAITYRETDEQFERIKKIANKAQWTISKTVGILVGESLANRECSESIRAVDGESAQEFMARLEAE